VVFATKRNERGRYEKEATVTFDAANRRVHRRIPVAFFAADWDGREDPTRPGRFLQDRVSPAAFAPFVEPIFQVDILHLDDRLCALRSSAGDLLLCKRRVKKRYNSW